MTDIAHVDFMIQAILRADHLNEETRMGYSKSLAPIATAARNKTLLHACVTQVLQCDDGEVAKRPDATGRTR
jgi:hypothetical protein